jgi:hypothetical protein
MGIRQGEADVMERVHEVSWDTEENEIEAIILILGGRIEQRNSPPIGYGTWTEVLIEVVRKRTQGSFAARAQT